MPFLLGDAASCTGAASTISAALPSASPPPFHFICLTLHSFPPVPLLLPAGFGGHPTLTWFVSWEGGRRAFGFLLVVMACLGPDRCAPPPLIALVAARPPSRPSLPHPPATGAETSRWWVRPLAFESFGGIRSAGRRTDLLVRNLLSPSATSPTRPDPA